MNIKIENWKLLVLSAFYFIFAFVSYQVQASEFLSFFKVAGIAIAVVGILQILIYLLKKDYLLLVFGGLVVTFKADYIVDYYRPVIGVLVVLDSILRLQYSMNLLRVKDKQWLCHLCLSLIPVTLGIVLVLFDLGSLLENYFSFLLILDGIANIYTVFYYKRFVKRMERITLDSDDGEIIVREKAE